MFWIIKPGLGEVPLKYPPNSSLLGHRSPTVAFLRDKLCETEIGKLSFNKGKSDKQRSGKTEKGWESAADRRPIKKPAFKGWVIINVRLLNRRVQK